MTRPNTNWPSVSQDVFSYNKLSAEQLSGLLFALKQHTQNRTHYDCADLTLFLAQHWTTLARNLESAFLATALPLLAQWVGPPPATTAENNDDNA